MEQKIELVDAGHSFFAEQVSGEEGLRMFKSGEAGVMLAASEKRVYAPVAGESGAKYWTMYLLNASETAFVGAGLVPSPTSAELQAILPYLAGWYRLCTL